MPYLLLFQIPQRYRFSSKSQLSAVDFIATNCCFRYHKGTDFQANHNSFCIIQVMVLLFQIPQRYRFSSKSQQRLVIRFLQICCFRYHKGTDFQANHNYCFYTYPDDLLFQIPQRYRFSSKSQLKLPVEQFNQGCFRYHKGTDFQANHNRWF